MGMSNFIRAKSKGKAVLFLSVALAVLSYVMLLRKDITSPGILFMVAVSIVIIPLALFDLCHSVFLTEEGIICYRFGSVYRKLAWEDITQVSVARDVHFSFITSSTTRIVFTPQSCEKYSPEKWSGIRYLLAFRRQVIWIDNSPKNHDFIEQYYKNL